MSDASESRKPGHLACPHCGSRNLLRVREGKNEFVIVPKRECKECGAVFSPPASLLFILVTAPVGLILLVVAVWAAFFNERLDESMAEPIAWGAFVFGLVLVGVTVQILRQREPRIHRTPRETRGAKPWDESKDEGW